MSWRFWRRAVPALPAVNPFAELHAAIDDVHLVVGRLARPKKAPCGVLLLRANTPQGPSMVDSRCSYLEPGEVWRGFFDCMVPVPPGSWIVAWGPCNVEVVTVGNNYQTMSPNTRGPAVVLADAAGVGVHISFALKAWEL